MQGPLRDGRGTEPEARAAIPPPLELPFQSRFFIQRIKAWRKGGKATAAAALFPAEVEELLAWMGQKHRRVPGARRCSATLCPGGRRSAEGSAVSVELPVPFAWAQLKLKVL